ANPQGRQRRTGAGYEKRDANAKWIFGIIAFLLITGLIMHFVLAGVVERFEKKPSPTDELTGTRRGAEPVMQRKAVPHLQLNPPVDLEKFRASEEFELHTYGSLD